MQGGGGPWGAGEEDGQREPGAEVRPPGVESCVKVGVEWQAGMSGHVMTHHAVRAGSCESGRRARGRSGTQRGRRPRHARGTDARRRVMGRDPC